jgi:hypothetical protein
VSGGSQPLSPHWGNRRRTPHLPRRCVCICMYEYIHVLHRWRTPHLPRRLFLLLLLELLCVCVCARARDVCVYMTLIITKKFILTQYFYEFRISSETYCNSIVFVLSPHAGSLTNLAKYPASTVQILGAEKALFRALKTKGNTPKYGLIFHSSFIGRASQKNKVSPPPPCAPLPPTTHSLLRIRTYSVCVCVCPPLSLLRTHMGPMGGVAGEDQPSLQQLF